MRRLIRIALFLFAIPAFATTYYVDNCVTVGSDSNNGTSTSTPWLTLSHAAATASAAGSTILVQGGCYFREQVTISHSGSSGNPITFSTYGTGRPKLTTFNLFASGWTNTSGNVWQVADTTQPFQAMFNGVYGTLETSTANLTAPNEWYWASNVLYVYATSNPGTEYTSPGVEADTRILGWFINGFSFVTLNGFELYGGNGGGETTVLIKNGSNNTVSNSLIHDGFVNVVVIQDTTTATTFNTLSGDTIYGCHGSGKQCIYVDLADNTTLSGNEIYNSFTDPGSNDLVDIVSSNTFTATQNYIHDTSNNGLKFTGSTNATVSYNKIANTFSPAVWFAAASNSGSALYNTFWQTSDGIRVDTSNSDILIGNSIYLNMATGECIKGVGTVSGTTIENNVCMLDTFTSQESLDFPAGTTTGATVNGNDWFYTLSGTHLDWNGTLYSNSTFATYQTASGNDANGFAKNPLYTNGPGDVLTLQGSSPAIGAGLNLGGTYSTALLPASTWPSGVQTGTQASAWNMGAYLTPGGINAFWWAIP